MTWTNAFDVGACALAYALNNTTVTIEELNEAGITVDTTAGVVTATWDGVTGSPTGLRIEVHPSYDISALPARISSVVVNSPLLGADPVADQGYGDFSFEFSPFDDLPWDAADPLPITFIGCFAASGV